MNKHAMAFVRWEIFRPGGGKPGERVYDYGSDQIRLVNLVGEGGTLWLVTSKGMPGNKTYHLAYKLADCHQIPKEKSHFSRNWKYVVRAQDWGNSLHFKYNNATDILRRLCFTSGPPMSEVSNMGNRIVHIPELTLDDVSLLQRFQHKIQYGRSVFMSYSHADNSLASSLEEELEKRDIRVSRDVTFLKPGEEWKAALEREAKSTDCFLVLVSANSAKSKWVREEVDWAMDEYRKQGLVKKIIPVVINEESWQAFPESIRKFQKWEFPVPENLGAFDRLSKAISEKN